MKKSVILIIFLFSISFVYATDCSISSCTNHLNFYASSTFNNAHVSSTQTAGYTPLCCAGAVTGTLTASVIDSAATCNGASAFLMSSEDNAHIAEIGNAQSTNYPKKLCLTGVAGLTCEYETQNPYTCDGNFFCLLKYLEVGGYTGGTNAHVASCTDTTNLYYVKKICCGVTTGPCGTYQQQCNTQSCCSGLQCSGPAENKGCCLEDEEWIPDPLIPGQGTCQETGSCSPDWSTQNQGSYQDGQACCDGYWRTIYTIYTI